MEVVRAPDQRLRVKTKPVKKITPHILQIFKEMVQLTKTFLDPEGVGLASTQIGRDEQYFILKQEDDSFLEVINPQIHSLSKKTKVYFEGCLSIPDYYGEVERSLSAVVSYMDKDGNHHQKIKLIGIPAWIFQHEYDHLQGKLFMDRVLENKSRLFKVAGKDKTGAEIFEEVNL